MTKPISPEVLAHYGVLGMKWGVRKDGKPQGFQYGDKKLTAPKRATKTTKRVIEDHNKLDNVRFKQKYGVSKRTYAKRVNKYGDPHARKANKKTYDKSKYSDVIGKNKPNSAVKTLIDREVRNRALNKEYKVQSIKDARERINSGRYSHHNIKAQYQRDAQDRGRAYAKDKRAAINSRKMADIQTASKTLGIGEKFVKAQYEVLTGKDFVYIDKNTFDNAKLAGLLVLGVGAIKTGSKAVKVGKQVYDKSKSQQAPKPPSNMPYKQRASTNDEIEKNKVY